MFNFSNLVKSEIIKNILNLNKNKEYINFLLFGLLFCNHKVEDSNSKYLIITELNNIELLKLFKQYFKINIISNNKTNLKNNYKKYLINFKIDINEYKNIFNFNINNLNDIDEIKTRLIMIGIFINYGNISDPKKKSYHLEIRCFNELIFDITSKILNKFHIEFHFLTRYAKKIIYIKKSELISDFLKLINCNELLYYFENCRIEKDFVSNIQRLNNLEVANINKKIKTNQLLIKYINKIKNSNEYFYLNENIKIYCDIRIKYPDLSMNEILVKINSKLDKHVTKSWINHSNIKIKNIYNKIKD